MAYREAAEIKGGFCIVQFDIDWVLEFMFPCLCEIGHDTGIAINPAPLVTHIYGIHRTRYPVVGAPE